MVSLPLVTMASAPATASKASAQTPAELKAFIPPGQKLLVYKGSGNDVALVIEKQKADADAPDITKGQRTLLLLHRIDGTLQTVLSNDKVIACSTCGDFMDDPFADHLLTLTPGHIHVEQYHGGRQPSSAIYDFTYDAASKQWRVSNAVNTRFADSGEGEKTIEKLPLASPALLSDFDPNWHKPEFWGGYAVNDKAHTFAAIVDASDEASLDKSIHDSCQSDGKCHVLVKQLYGCMALARDGAGQFYTATSQKKKAADDVAHDALKQCTAGSKGACEVLRHSCSTGW